MHHTLTEKENETVQTANVRALFLVKWAAATQMLPGTAVYLCPEICIATRGGDDGEPVQSNSPRQV